jgi:hypothetical protein
MKYESPPNKPRKPRRVPPPPPAPERRRSDVTPLDATRPAPLRALPPPPAEHRRSEAVSADSTRPASLRTLPPPPPLPVPKRSDSGGPGLDTLFDELSPPAPAFSSLRRLFEEASADRATPQPQRPEPPKDTGKLVNVPMICAVTDRPFLLMFREAGGFFNKRYDLQSVVADLGAGGTASSTLSLPVTALNWEGIKCPHCSGTCRPILCGKCQRLACDGRVRKAASFTVFACAPSCGMVGPIDATLETINGSEGGYAQRPPAGGSPSRAQSAAPRSALMLPKPR